MVLPSGFSCFHGARLSTSIFKQSKRVASTRVSSVLLEQPIIVVKEECVVDLIGPPDALSHLRPIVRQIRKDETVLQRKFREAADATQKWNQDFWAAHNASFLRRKDDFVKGRTCTEKTHLNADEMSEFYRDFLNENWKNHVTYNFQWYRRNFRLLFLALSVSLENKLL